MLLFLGEIVLVKDHTRNISCLLVCVCVCLCYAMQGCIVQHNTVYTVDLFYLLMNTLCNFKQVSALTVGWLHKGEHQCKDYCA